MSAFWCEPFDEYPDSAHMLNGTWAQVDAGWAPSTANPRTGTKALRWTPGASGIARRIFGAPVSGAGVEYAAYFNQLPSGENLVNGGGENTWLGGFCAADGTGQVLFYLGSDGAVVACTGFTLTAGLYIPVVIARSAPCIQAKTYNQIGLKVGNVSATVGTIEARVNGVTVLNASGCNTDYALTGEVSQIALNTSNIFYSTTIDIDDLHAWSTIPGDGPSDFVGNAAVYYLPFDSDTATADWVPTPNTTPVYPKLSDNNDATYIASDTVGQRSAFGFTDLPGLVQGVVYLQNNWRGLKTDSGDCTVEPGFISGSNESDGPGQPMTEVETWRWWVEPYDPSTSGAPWTPATVNAAEAVYQRTA